MREGGREKGMGREGGERGGEGDSQKRAGREQV